MNLPEKPFDIIALSLSGGGYRATAFHLGSISYLDKLRFRNETLLSRVKILSTVSGGTFTGVKYASCLSNGKSLKECYDELYHFMSEINIVEESLRLLGSDGWNKYKTPNLINAFSEIYYKYITQDKFGILWSENSNQLTEIIFNSTDFSHGINFRFQKTKNDYGFIGNFYIRLNAESAREILLSDIIAASSCFPSGFEPMSFPEDFRNADSVHLNNFGADGADLNKSDFPLYLMDGGIYDNQGIDGVILAKDRMKKVYPELDMKENPVDLYIISDVSGAPMKPLKISISESKRLFYRLTFARLRTIGAVFLLIAFFSLTALILSDQKVFIVLFTSLAWVSGILGIISSFIGKILVKKIPKWFHISPFFMSPLKLINRLSFDVLRHFIIERKESVLKMVSEVFLKQIRRLSYRVLYRDASWKNRLIMNALHELIPEESKPINEGSDNFSERAGIEPGNLVKAAALKAYGMGTTLWFEPEQLEGKENTLNSLIACGQFTICFNLIEYIAKLKKEMDYLKYSQEIKDEIDSLNKLLLGDWEKFNINPFWLQQELVTNL